MNGYYFNGDRTTTEVYISDDGRLTGMSFWSTRPMSQKEIRLDEPYNKKTEKTVRQIAELYDSGDNYCRELFHDAFGTAKTLRNLLELLDGTFDYCEFYKNKL